MASSRFKLPPIQNEPMLDYRPGSVEREKLKAACEKLRKEAPLEVPCYVGGKEIRTGVIGKQFISSDHQKVLATYHKVTPELMEHAIKSALEAKPKWERMPFAERAAIFLKAATLLATKYRAEVCAAVMLGTGKTVWQAEIDAAAESIDFLRFNCQFAQQLYDTQTESSSPQVWNRMEARPLEGFVYAVTPFNFAAIGTNLATQPAVLGNVVLWKPASSAVLGNWLTYKVLLEAGLPPGVINFVPGDGRVVSPPVLAHPMIAGVHFTGSTATFNSIWLALAKNLEHMRSYPRMVGETGGKNFHLMHPSAAPELDSVVGHTIRAAFEYQGQKCSACSRLYAPESVWPQMRQTFISEVAKIKVGQPDDFSTFMTAVVDKAAFDSITDLIKKGMEAGAEVVCGGKWNAERGYFIEPTILLTKNPKSVTMETEIFGPVLTVYVYPDAQFEQTLDLVDQTSPYALTGAIFARDRAAIELASDRLKHAAGNLYINDKSTGAVVGQQPFGGARQSGTNDKAGSAVCLQRWISWRTIKESFAPLSAWTYPHQL